MKGLDADMVSKLLSAALEGALQNQTITIERQEFLESLGLGGVNWPPFFPPPLNGNNTSGTDDKGNGEDEIVINLGNIPNVTIDRVIHDYIEKHWDTIMDNFTPDKLSIECTVVDGVDDPHGKWPKSLGNVAILESRYLMRSVSHMIPDNPFFQDLLAQILGLRDPDDPHHYDLQKEVASVDLNAYALMVIAQYAGRFSTYQKSTEGMNLDLIEFTNEMVEALGVYYPVELTLPVQEILVGLNYLRMFLDQIFNAVLIILVGMGVMLIYSLLLSDVEDKTYEYGMLRALGLPHNALIELLLIQALFYAIPGITFGLIISQLLSAPIIYFMVQYSSVPASYLLQVDTIVLGCTLGILMPIISNIAPIQRALSRTLRDSLDVYHQTSQQIDVQMVKLETLGLDPWQIACALMMVFVGFLIYYVVPLAFIFLNVSLFLTILNGILLGMLLGATIVATLFQPILERQILKLLLWGRDRKLEILIQKSLAGHRIRNRKTALMYSICLAFIIFAGAMFTLQATALNDNVKAGIGSDINIISAMIKNPLPEENMRVFLEEQLRVPEPDRIVEMYSFLTFSMWDMHDVRSNYVTNLADFPWHRLNVYGADKDYLNSVYGDYYIPSEWDKSFDYQGVNDDHSKPDIIRSLYTDAGQQVLTIEKSKEEGGLGVGIPPQITSSQSVGVREGQTSFYFRGNEETYTQYIDAICSEALRYASFLDTDTAVKMDVSARYIENYSVTLKYLVKMRAMVTKMSGFFFSSYRQTAFGSPLIVSMDQYQSIVDDIYSIKRHGYLQLGHTTEEADELVGEVPSTPPKQRLFIRIKAKSTLAERELVMNGLRNFLQDSTTVVLDTTDLLATTEVATWALLLFFDLIAAISCSMCFFVLWLSFTSNIKENSWEFGVLRAVGLSAAQVTRVYIYEALAIILSALVLGSFTGITVAVTLTLQFNLFVEMPFHFQFPYTLFVSVLIMSIVVAIGGSYLASRDIKRKQIAQVLKGSL